MNTSSSKCKLLLFVLIALLLSGLLTKQSRGQERRAPGGGRRAVVVDERLAVLRATPELSGQLLRRLGRGRLVAITRERRSRDGVLFYQVNVTRRTRGWIQRDAVVSMRPGDDGRLLRLVSASEDFDRIARARIFLDSFPRSRLRPAVLLLYGDEAEQAAAKLALDAARRLNKKEMTANGAPIFSYYLNYNGLDRYRKQGITFTFDEATRRFHYNGAAWREIIRRHPKSNEAALARQRLEIIATDH